MPAHLFIFRGLPASGKSSIAKAMLDAGLLDAVVCRDDTRQELEPGRKYQSLMSEEDREFELRVRTLRNERIADALAKDLRVACTDTNLSGTAMRELHTLAGSWAAPVSVLTLEVPESECRARDRARAARVGGCRHSEHG